MVVSPGPRTQQATQADALAVLASTPPPPPPPHQGGKWFGGGSKEHASYMLTYRLDAESRCGRLCPEQVEQACNAFQSAWLQQESADKETQWRMAIRFHEAMMPSSSSPQSIISKLADSFHCLEQNGRCISRANFVRCARQVALGAGRDPRLAKSIDDMFSAFDPRNRNQIDWRIMLFSVYIASKPRQSCRDVLRNAFRYYVGEAGDILDCPPSGCVDGGIPLRDFRLVLSPLVRVESMPAVLNLFDNAWTNVSSASAAPIDSDLLLTLRSFDQILDDASIKSLLEETISVGNGSALNFNLCAFEHQYYPSALLHYIQKSRRAMAIANFMRDLDKAQLKAVVFQWKLYCSRRRHARELVDTMTHRLWHKLATKGFNHLRRWVMYQVAAVEIQRLLRGFLCRIDAGVRHVLTFNSVLLQSCARRYLERCRYVHLCQRREDASIAIQRIARGNRDRRIAIFALLARIEKERLELEMAKKNFEHHRQTRAAIVIQRLHRSYTSRQDTWKRLCRKQRPEKS